MNNTGDHPNRYRTHREEVFAGYQEWYSEYFATDEELHALLDRIADCVDAINATGHPLRCEYISETFHGGFQVEGWTSVEVVIEDFRIYVESHDTYNAGQPAPHTPKWGQDEGVPNGNQEDREQEDREQEDRQQEDSRTGPRNRPKHG